MIEDFTGRDLLLKDTKPEKTMESKSYETPRDFEENDKKWKEEISKLNNELNAEKSNNIKLTERIKELEIINKKTEEEKTKQKTKELSNEINEEEDLMTQLLEKIKVLNNNIKTNDNKEKTIELLEEIRLKNKMLSNFPFKLSEGEHILSVIFVSSDQKMHYSTLCKNTDKFSTIENMLYDAYPEYTDTKNNYFVNGNKIDKYKSLDFNKIKNNDVITLKTSEKTNEKTNENSNEIINENPNENPNEIKDEKTNENSNEITNEKKDENPNEIINEKKDENPNEIINEKKDENPNQIINENINEI